jgi:hypothetical protein
LACTLATVPNSAARTVASRLLAGDRGTACPALANAIDIRVTRMSCGQASSAVQTYETSPSGCVSARRCVQSGIDHSKQVIIDDCRRQRLSVTCTVYIASKDGSIVNPRIAGSVIVGRFDRASVTFRMRHDVHPRHGG